MSKQKENIEKDVRNQEALVTKRFDEDFAHSSDDISIPEKNVKGTR